MLTTFEQVREWITDNGFKRWVLYKDRTRAEKILDSNNYPSDQEDKLAMTEKYLRMSGGSAYAAGAPSSATSDLTTTCEIRLSDTQPAAGVGMVQPIVDEDKIAARIEAKLRAEYERKEYERKRNELDKERKAFEEEKASAMGAIAHYFAPVGRAILGNMGMPRVAGVDTEEPTYAQPIHAIKEDAEQEPEQKEQKPAEGEIFTEDEANKLFELMARFKKVEPDYLKLIESVVVMAENGDATYNMAKGFLIK